MRVFQLTRGVVAALAVGLPLLALAEGEEQFDTPQEAVAALTEAARGHDTNAMRTIFGAGSRELISADPVQASNAFAMFVGRVTNKVSLANLSPQSIALELGSERWPFPIPLVEAEGKWSFDTKAGREEILNRRIGRNELAVINVCHAYVAAQQEYYSQPHSDVGVLEYAQRLRSSPGRHDGLYWHADAGQEPSPLGPLISEAHALGYRHENKILSEPQNPYHGYLFRILTRQGRFAPGGKYNYIINGHMVAGFALVAWPAQWGNTGIMTFIVNQEGKVYQKNLGPETDTQARHIKSYDPDPSWQPVDYQ